MGGGGGFFLLLLQQPEAACTMADVAWIGPLTCKSVKLDVAGESLNKILAHEKFP